ncbi:unnamed protein product [Ascophyllum nodosum]
MTGVDEEDVDLLDFFSGGGDTQASTSPPTHETHNVSTCGKSIRQTHEVSNRTSPVVKSSARRSGPASPSSSSPKTSLSPLTDFTEAYSGLRVRNRLLSGEDMRLRMKGRKVHRLAELRAVPMRALESQDPSDAWAVLGVLVSKSTRRQAANGGSYVIWTLSDLSRKDHDVSVFLFREALGSHWTTCEGTLMAVLSAKVLPPKGGAGGGKDDHRLALSVDAPWQMSRVGMAMDYAICKGKRKDGKPCTMPVNKTQGGGFCEFHVVAAFNRSQRKDPLGNKSKTSKDDRRDFRITLSTSVRHFALFSGARSHIFQGRVSSTATAARSATWDVTHRRTASTINSLPSFKTGSLTRRDGVGAARFGENKQAILGVPAREAIPLRPSNVRAAGRTTVLSSLPPAFATKTAPRLSSNQESQAVKTSEAASSPPGFGQVKVDKGCGGRARSSGADKLKADPMGLAWAYGKKPGEGLKGKIKTISAAALTTTRMLTHEGCDTTENAHGEKKKDVDRSAARGQQNGKKRFEAHPAGYMDGSVPVPAESKVFMTMPRRFGVRADGSRTEEGVKQLHESLILRKQHIVKQNALARGILLRPADPISTIGGKSKDALVKGKTIRPRSTADAVLGASKRAGSGGTDPFAKRIKTMTAVEKELLLQRVSKYAGLAEEERAKDSDRRMQRLEQREDMAQKAEEVTKMTVTVFHCQECKIRRGHFSKRCRDLGHQQKGVKATLRFFECTICRRRKSCTERVPHTGCEFCGKNEWKRCGARPGRGHAEDSRDKRFVAAMSEWTDQRDLSLAAADVR